MTIKEVSEKYDIPADTLRYYERVGMIPPVTRTGGGIRDYQDTDIGWVLLAKCMRAAGLPVEVMIEYLKLYQQGSATISARHQHATWFHFSGITPAISDEMTNICITACQKAKEKGMTVSCDLNYRSKLWSSEKACEAMSRICQYVDVCIANEDDAIGIFSMNPADANGEEKNAYIAKELMKKFPFKMVASVWRTETSITTFKLQSMIYTEGKAYYSKEFFMHILDYIGAGDAYCAGLIYSLINNFDPQKAVEFSNAASCLKHTVSGDYNLVTVDEVMKLAFSDAGNEVQR